MFGIGLGEILLILFILFLISPKDLPKILKNVGRLFKELNIIKNEIADTVSDNKADTNKKKEKQNVRLPLKKKGNDS